MKFGPIKERFIQKHGQEKGTKLYEQYLEKTGTSLQSFIKRHGVQNGTQKYNQYREKISKSGKGKNSGSTKQKFIKKHGQQIGIEKYNQWLSKCSQSLQGFINRYGEVQGRKKFEQFRSKSLQTKENFIKRYGQEQGAIKWQQHLTTHRNSSKRSLNYWLIQCQGDLQLANKKLIQSQSRSKQWFIEKFGKQQGEKRYINRLEKQSKTFKLRNRNEDFKRNGKKFSKISYQFFKDILIKLDEEFDIVCFGSKQKKIFDQNRSYLCDFYLKKNDIQLVIEFFGDFWHSNPQLYTENFINPVTKTSSLIVWKNDEERLNSMKLLVNDVFVIWEKQVKIDREKAINKCIKFIKENLNGNYKN